MRQRVTQISREKGEEDRSVRIKPRWLSSNQAKRETEIFFLKWSVGWILIFGTVVVTQIYKKFGDLEYFSLGCLVAFPHFLWPLLFPASTERNLPLSQRYFVKANVWIGIFGYVGNYFWTHYFFKVLHATYEFPISWELNRVPICLYLITHAYFCFYHVITTAILRRFWTSQYYLLSSNSKRKILSIALVFFLSYFTAFMEAFTISSVPYYVIEDRYKMYLIGSAFYGIYFYVSFPMFYRLDEDPAKKWTVKESAIDGLAAAMLVTILLDLWRLFLGNVVGDESTKLQGPPWI
eukprot:TRINITY_DN3081_c0_g1_i1.p1 TRINITY_DN3081_c0_g1~~TRINITY_DN3081_c0_g1_i1.p1  ORF type:complete len:293 (+),score=78.39 TRINITY_DN3081_c0_g1_i1:88-966(+)